MTLGEKDWQGGSSADRIWQRGYDRLGWQDKVIINDFAEEKFDGDKIEAMKARFKGNIAMALLGYLPKYWQLFSQEERQALQKTYHDSELRKALNGLLAGSDSIDDTTPIDESTIKKNSGPKKKE